ncbi:SagB/ThcOx family dehydrogenase [Mesorhizobium sp. RP14(2022)]|uniref:SagB/ThcOx family dehydrogenase n=1 Tax=Mesorhizobium liriopis TaxID=2953882 RepID=A0ABT1C8U1_9HYPH|nr:SagB/ThcOx family dehydrogenase [Mesorhizobium liriopis]MCO6051258.1 SagB/ThcOx family dehydrogenase [Mesorhizobium liriopis]
MRVKAASTLVYSPEGDALVACNFLTKQVFHCEVETLRLLSDLSEWTDAADLAQRYELSVPETRDLLQRLIDVSALVRADSAEALREDDFAAHWAWSVPTALMHFTLEDRPFMALEEAEDRQVEKASLGNVPELARTNRDLAEVVELPDPFETSALLRFMAGRRTVRGATAAPITLSQLSETLFAGLGILGETTNRAGRLPLKLTPSGGARNPYEAYVFAYRVEGLEPGIYHYSASEHTLGRVPSDALPSGGEVIGGQDWADSMACSIVLCAHFERTMWKYDDPNAYRVVLIEAGHVGQNIMLAATQHGLTACPSAALSHETIRSAIGLEGVTISPVYALALGVPDAEPEISRFPRWKNALASTGQNDPAAPAGTESSDELRLLLAMAEAEIENFKR